MDEVADQLPFDPDEPFDEDTEVVVESPAPFEDSEQQDVEGGA